LKNDQYHECGEINIPGTWYDAPYGKYQGVRDLDDRLREWAVEIGSDPLQDEPKQEGQQVEISKRRNQENEWIAHDESLSS
jgi:hypothetical protein